MSRAATYVCWESFYAISLLASRRSVRKLNKSTCYKPSTLKNFDFAFFFLPRPRDYPKRNFPGLKIDENFAQTRPEGSGMAAVGSGPKQSEVRDSTIHVRGDFKVRVQFVEIPSQKCFSIVAASAPEIDRLPLMPSTSTYRGA